MPRVIRVGIDFSQGHLDYNPTIVIGSNVNIPGVGCVYANGIPIVVLGDLYDANIHQRDPRKVRHDGMMAAMGSNNVFIKGFPIHRDGDPISCGDVADNGSPDVFSNGAGLGGPAAINDSGETTGYATEEPVIIYPLIVDIKYNAIFSQEKYLYKSGIYMEIDPIETYTRLVEESSNKVFKNYPGAPLTIKSGAVLPSYAPDTAKNKIDIILSLESTLPKGFGFNPNTGKISGSLSGLSPVVTTIIKAKNYVGESKAIIHYNYKPVVGM